MALELSARALVLSQQRSIKPNLILEIDGVTTIYSAIETIETLRIGSGHLIGEAGLLIGGTDVIVDQDTLISLSGSGATITQQLLQDKGATSSVSSLSIDLVDKDGVISELVSPGFIVDDILTRRAQVYLNFESGLHPEDSVLVHQGIIDEVTPQQGIITLRIASPEALKRQDLFIAAATKINGAINNSVTTITVDTTNGFILPSSPELLSYIKIDDEYIQYTGTTATTFTGCTRAALGSVAAAHADNADVGSLYTLTDNAIDLSLKLMLSLGDSLTQDIQYIGAIDIDNMDANTLAFDDFNIQETLGLSIGDLVTITGATNGGNNIVLSSITGFGVTDSGSYVTVANTLILELETSATAAFKSQYNVLSEGMGMTMQDVDVERHLDIQTKFSSVIPDYYFYVKDTIKGKDFLSEQLYLPAGLYSLPRKSKASVGITVPPLAEALSPTIDNTRIVDSSKLKSTRSINKNFYNAVVFKYDQNLDDDKYSAGKIDFSADSEARIPNVGNKVFTVISDGLRQSDATETLLRISTRRILERYQFASEFIQGIKVLYKDGFKMECGDIVIATPPNLTDLDTGNRTRTPKLYEVVNKSMNVRTGEISLDLLGTNFALDRRYGVVSPSSYVDTGSTVNQIMIKDSFSTVSPAIERDKWIDFIGEQVMVRSADWSFNETTTFTGFDPGNKYKMLVSPDLSAPPSANYIIDIPYYNDGIGADSRYKLIFAHFDPHVLVVTGVSGTKFTVAPGDVVKFFVGSVVRVHNNSYSIDAEGIVSDVTGVTITLEATLGFTPAVNYEVDLIGFQDNGKGYALV